MAPARNARGNFIRSCFNVRLLFIVVTVVTVLMALIMLFFQSTRKTYPGFTRWTLGASGMAAGFVFLILRGIINDYLSILVVNVSFPLGVVWYLDGMRKFLSLKPMSKFLYIFPLISLLACTYYYFAVDAAAWRNLFMSVTVAIPNWIMAFLIFRHSPKKESAFYPIIGMVILSSGLLILIRSFWVLFMPDFDVLSESPVQIGYFISVIIMQIAGIISFILLNSERLERELENTEINLKKTVDDLQKALVEVKTLGGLLPICANCKKIRDDSGYWHQLEAYISTHSEAEFSHGTCPECARKLYPELF
jgi:hypothetical protein